MPLTEPQLRRNTVAALTRHHPGSPELAQARRDLTAAKIVAYVQRAVADAPPLSAEQRDRLALLLRGAAEDVSAA